MQQIFYIIFTIQNQFNSEGQCQAKQGVWLMIKKLRRLSLQSGLCYNEQMQHKRDSSSSSSSSSSRSQVPVVATLYQLAWDELVAPLNKRLTTCSLQNIQIVVVCCRKQFFHIIFLSLSFFCLSGLFEKTPGIWHLCLCTVLHSVLLFNSK